jgi:hypothetical protein
MSRKPSLLASALKTANRETSVSEVLANSNGIIPPGRRAGAEATGPTYIPPSRANKVGRTHHLQRAYWETLEEISFRTRDEKGKRVPQERLVAEALNLLFVKYNYPQVQDPG